MMSTLLNLARVQMERNDLRRAEGQVKRAQKILRPLSRKNGRDWVEYLDTKAALSYYKGEYTQADNDWRNAQSIAEEHMGSEHPTVLVILAHRGELHALLREKEQAMELFERCLKLREKTLGADHPDVAIVMAHLAILYGREHEDVKAAELYEKAIQILRPDSNSNAMYLGLTLRYQGEFQRARSAWTEAAKSFEDSLKILEGLLGDNHPLVGHTMKSYAAVLKKCKRKDDAKIYEQRARVILEEPSELMRVPQHTVDIRTLQRTRGNN